MRRGFALPLAILVVGVVATFTLVLATVSSQEMRVGKAVRDDAACAQAAEGGMAVLARILEEDEHYAASAQGTLSGRADAPVYSWTFAAGTSDARCVNNLTGATPVRHPDLGIDVPPGYAYLAVTARMRGGKPMTVNALYRQGEWIGLGSARRIVLGDVDSVAGFDAEVYSNAQASDLPDVAAIVLESLDGEAFTRIDGSEAPVVVARPTDQTIVHDNQPAAPLPDVNPQAILEESRRSDDRVVVRVDALSRVHIDDFRADKSVPLPFAAADFTGVRDALTRKVVLTYRPPTRVSLPPGRWLFEGSLVVLSSNKLELQAGAVMVVDGDFTEAGNLQASGGVVVATGAITVAQGGADNDVSLIAGGLLSITGGGRYRGFYYSRSSLGVAIVGAARVQGAVIAYSGDIVGPNVDYTYDPDAFDRLRPIVRFHLIRTAWFQG